MAGTCWACGSTALREFHHQDSIPMNSCLLLKTEAEAVEFPTGRMRLTLCDDCGFVFNADFIAGASTYSSAYEETQAFSPRFQDFARRLAARWVDDHDLHGKRILEIGCGKGEFLVHMLEAGAGSGIGIDPGTHPERVESPVGERIEWITDFYDEGFVDLEADAIVCRHTLEHIQPVADFMRLVRRTVGDRIDIPVLFELPDVQRVLDEAAFWDVYYEHCSYFSAGSLARLFRATGFEVTDLRLDYDDQYLLLEARAVPAGAPADAGRFPLEDDLGRLRAAAERFAAAYAEKIGGWRTELDAVVANGGRAVIWGAGSKGVAFLTAEGIGPSVHLAVDINPFKEGMFMAGTGREIIRPEALVEVRPDLVIAMNPVYVEEIRTALAGLGLTPPVVAV